MSPRPLFVVCPPRSGSTFLVSLLDSHPRVTMTNEASWVTFLRKAFLLSSTPSSQWVDDGEGFRTPGILPERYTRTFAESFLTTVQPLVDELFRRVAGDTDRDYYGDKVMSCNDLAFAIERFPDAVFVQLVRDPRDMIASTFAFSQKQPASWDEASFQVRVDHMRSFLSETTAMLAGQRTLQLRYEDLMSDPDGCVSSLFDFLGLDVAEEEHEFLRGAAKKLFASHGTSATPQASIGRWRQDLTQEQQDIANAGLGDVLRQFGYCA